MFPLVAWVMSVALVTELNGLVCLANGQSSDRQCCSEFRVHTGPLIRNGGDGQTKPVYYFR